MSVFFESCIFLRAATIEVQDRKTRQETIDSDSLGTASEQQEILAQNDACVAFLSVFMPRC